MRPALPDAEALMPYLRQIDANAHYTNFGPLQKELLNRLINIQTSLEDSKVTGLLTSSATQGLELAISALDLPQNSKILVPALTFIATATAVQRCGHIPVVADVDPETWMLSPNTVNLGVNDHEIKAVIPVATFGMPQDSQNWSNWQKSNGIPVIIDAASSFGAQQSAEGITVVFSLHATKALSTAEGGLVITRDPQLSDRLQALTNFGIGRINSGVGTNAKLSEYHAAIGLAHLDIWPAQINRRRDLLKFYQDSLNSEKNHRLRFQKNTGLFAPSVFNIRLCNAKIRSNLEAAFEHQGIQTRRWYQPLLQNQPILKGVMRLGLTPTSDELADTLIGLPFFIDMTQDQVKQIRDIVLSMN
jgi:dTDP-4-amino-4,6-dideoxygalactose transaminase